MAKLSVVISAFNEEEKIEDCLKSVKFADEIIVVDNQSSDKTASIAKKYTKHVFTRKNNLMLNINKNYGFSKASGNWILSLDADERIPSELAEEIRFAVDNEQTTVNGYWIPRKNIIFGKWIQNEMWWPDYQLRLFKKGEGKFPEKHVHEYVEVAGETAKLKEPMIHENYQTISQFMYKLNTIYTESEVENFIKSGKQIQWYDAIRFPARDFIKIFFLQRGYKDGLHGLVLSLLQAFYMEIVFVKLWEKQGFPQYENKNFLQEFYRESKKIAHEFEYWFLTVFAEGSSNPIKKTVYKLWRKTHAQEVNNS